MALHQVFWATNRMPTHESLLCFDRKQAATALNQASALSRLEPQLHSNVYVSKSSTCPSHDGETREELLGLHRPRLNRLLRLTKEGLSAKVLRKRSGR